MLAVAALPTPLLAEHWYTPSWCRVTCTQLALTHFDEL